MLSLKRDEQPTTLYAELIRRGLPADYARRAAEEIDDHRADLLADLCQDQATDPEATVAKRLGKARSLAKKIACDYQRRSLFGRWPVVSFFVFPPILLASAWAAIVLTMWLLLLPFMPATYSEATVWRDAESARLVTYSGIFLLNVLAPCSVAWVCGRIALRTTLCRGYLLSCCLTIGLLSGVPFQDHRLDPDDPSRAMNVVGFMLGDLSAMAEWYLRPIQAMQTLAPVVVGGVLLWRDGRRRREALLAPPGATNECAIAA